MSQQELPSGSKNGHEFKLVMPSLVTPYAGVFEEVYAQYLDDPDKFAVSLAFRMENENPNLLGLFAEALNMSANEDLTHKWITVYYEMFARSLGKLGLPAIFVSDNIMNGYLKTKELRYISASNGNHDLREKLAEEKRERRLRDEALSPELISFWKSVDNDIESELTQGASEGDISSMKVGLLLLQEVLQRQEDEYAIAATYSLK